MNKNILILFLLSLVGLSGFSQNNRKKKPLPLELELSTQGGFYDDEIILEMRLLHRLNSHYCPSRIHEIQLKKRKKRIEGDV